MVVWQRLCEGLGLESWRFEIERLERRRFELKRVETTKRRQVGEKIGIYESRGLGDSRVAGCGRVEIKSGR